MTTKRLLLIFSITVFALFIGISAFYYLTVKCPGCEQNKLNEQTAQNMLGQKYSALKSPSVQKTAETRIVIPFIGVVDAGRFSLPVLTLVIGLVDGFNPCAMWVLLFLLSLLVGMENGVKRWTCGLVFLTASALVYFGVLAAWLNLFLYLGAGVWVRGIIGLTALLTGYYYLRKYLREKDRGCPAADMKHKEQVFARIRSILQSRYFFLTILGLLALAVVVNLVELACSAGLPAVYTKILAMHSLPPWQYYLYLLLYLVAFMADDLLVFGLTMTTLSLTGISDRYRRYLNLIGGCLMLISGVFLVWGVIRK